MKKTTVFLTLFSVGLFLICLSACAPKDLPGEFVDSNPDPSGQVTTEPTIAPVQNQDTGDKTTIGCDKIVPPDELNLILNQRPATLTEQTAPDETTCTWQYTSENNEPGQLQVWVGFGTTAEVIWNNIREAEISTQTPDLVIININGLGDENYAWTSKPDNQQVVYVRHDSQMLILHFQAADILYLGNESGIIDISDRIFTRLGRVHISNTEE